MLTAAMLDTQQLLWICPDSAITDVQINQLPNMNQNSDVSK